MRALLVAVTLVAIAASNGASPVERPFAPESFWNRPVPAGSSLDPESDSLVQSLISQKDRFGPYVNTTQYSTPVYEVGPDQAPSSVHLDTPSSMYSGARDAAALERSLAAVPIPDGAQPAAGTDGHMVVWQPSSDTMWELWIAKYAPPGTGSEPGWHAAWGARIDHVSRNSGRVEAPFGATASGLPLLGGLIRVGELESGTIDHVLSMAVPEVSSARFVWPATRSDGNSVAATAIPEGTRFRLDPSLDLEALGLPPATLAIARAAQRYGIVVTDRSGSVSLYAEDPTPLGTNPYLSLFGGQSPASLLAAFPWDHLQALAPVGPPS